jgi:sugar lactone lactonase YvrE
LALLTLLAVFGLLTFCAQSGMAGSPLALEVPAPAPSPTPAAYTVATLVPDGELRQPAGIAVDKAGNLYIADTGNRVIRKWDSSHKLTVFAGVPGRRDKYEHFDKAAAEAAGQPIPDCTSTTGDYCLATAALFSGPRSIVVDSKGNVYISDGSASKIRKVHAATGRVTVYAGKDGGGWNDTSIHNPEGIALDARGNLYIADKGNNAIRKVSPPSRPLGRGTITTVAGLGPKGPACSADGVAADAAALNEPQDVAVDPAGNIFIADTGCHKIRQIGLDGKLTTVVGGDAAPSATSSTSGDWVKASEVRLDKPTGVEIDGAGNLYITDAARRVVWLYDPGTKKARIIGGLTTGSKLCSQRTNDFGDGCPGTQARLNTPDRVAVDAQGNVYVPERGGAGAPRPPFAIRVLHPPH